MELGDLAPYTSLVLGRIREVAQRTTMVGKVLEDLETVLALGAGRRARVETVDVTSQDSLDLGALHYTERRPPRWLAEPKDAQLVDETNHLVVVCRRDIFVAIFLSEGGAKPLVARAFDRDSPEGLSGLRPIDPGLLNAAFVDGPARTLWLSGIHRQTSTKADSKILAGSNLQDALNPLHDQSYFFTAARSATQLPNQAGPMAVGVSPRRSRIWAGPTRRWTDFRGNVKALLGKLKATEEPEESPLPVLAAPAAGTGAVDSPYDVSIVAPELLADDPGLDPELREMAERWAYRAAFRVVASDGLAFSAQALLDGEAVAVLVFEPVMTGGKMIYGVKLEAGSFSSNQEDLAEEAALACRKTRWLKVRFESGHTIADGILYSMRYRDVRFENWVFPDLTGFDVKKEKPGQGAAFDIPGIGAAGEKSLFSWTQRNWPFPFESAAAARQRGWLASDDGAGEIADFIHYDFQLPGQVPLLSLIHVKASGTDNPNRGLSTSDYEVVVGQAVKNLRSLDRTNLADRLEQGANKNVASAVWLDGQKQADRAAFIQKLRDDGENFDRRVVVLQPRVREAAYEAARQAQGAGEANSIVARLQQLDTLLVGAEADCRDLGAEFVVVGALQP